MRKVYILLIVTVLSIYLCASSNNTTTIKNILEIEALKNTLTQKEEQIKTYQDKIKELEGQLKSINNETGNQSFKNIEFEKTLKKLNDEYYTKKLKELFSKEELKQLSYRAVQYSLTVNGTKFSDKIVKVPQGEIIIAVSERLPLAVDGEGYLLPEEIVNMGLLSGNNDESYSSHIQIKTDLNYITSPAAGIAVSGMGYIFENSKSGSVIKVLITDELKTRLGLTCNEFEITVF